MLAVVQLCACVGAAAGACALAASPAGRQNNMAGRVLLGAPSLTAQPVGISLHLRHLECMGLEASLWPARHCKRYCSLLGVFVRVKQFCIWLAFVLACSSSLGPPVWLPAFAPIPIPTCKKVQQPSSPRCDLQVSLWDVRGAGRGARVAKLSPGPQHGHFYCLSASDDGVTPLIGVLTHCTAYLQERYSNFAMRMPSQQSL